MPQLERVVYTDLHKVGARKDIHGILLLDTALQSRVLKPEQTVKVELRLAEVSLIAILLV